MNLGEYTVPLNNKLNKFCQNGLYLNYQYIIRDLFLNCLPIEGVVHSCEILTEEGASAI